MWVGAGLQTRLPVPHCLHGHHSAPPSLLSTRGGAARMRSRFLAEFSVVCWFVVPCDEGDCLVLWLVILCQVSGGRSSRWRWIGNQADLRTPNIGAGCCLAPGAQHLEWYPPAECQWAGPVVQPVAASAMVVESI